MRLTLLLIIPLLVFGCSSKDASQNEPDAEAITKYGVIVAKEEVKMEDIEQDIDVDTRIYASISSGGRVSIGLGFLLSPFTKTTSKEDPVRYQVEFIDGGEMTIYHLSHLFEIDDCVEITVYPDEAEDPPTMVRNKDACQT